MNAVFTKRDGESVVMSYENLRFFCEKSSSDIFMKSADEYTASTLNSAVGEIVGKIMEWSNKMISFEFYDTKMGYEAKCLYCYQTSCMPFIRDVLEAGGLSK